MSNKIVKLIILINRTSDKLRQICDDMDKISNILQEPEFLAVSNENNQGVLTPEDYD